MLNIHCKQAEYNIETTGLALNCIILKNRNRANYRVPKYRAKFLLEFVD